MIPRGKGPPASPTGSAVPSHGMRSAVPGTPSPVDDAETRADEVRRRFVENPPQAMTDDDMARFDMIVAGIGDVGFPTSQAELVARAARSGDDELATELRSLPDDARFSSLDELMLAMGVGSAGRIDVPGAPPRKPYADPPTFSS